MLDFFVLGFKCITVSFTNIRFYGKVFLEWVYYIIITDCLSFAMQMPSLII